MDLCGPVGQSRSRSVALVASVATSSYGESASEFEAGWQGARGRKYCGINRRNADGHRRS